MYGVARRFKQKAVLVYVFFICVGFFMSVFVYYAFYTKS